MTTKSLFLACSVAAVLLGTAPVRAENLIEVYLDAVRSDPLVREAVLQARMDAEAYNLAAYHTAGRMERGDDVGAVVDTDDPVADTDQDRGDRQHGHRQHDRLAEVL